MPGKDVAAEKSTCTCRTGWVAARLTAKRLCIQEPAQVLPDWLYTEPLAEQQQQQAGVIVCRLRNSNCRTDTAS